MHRKTTSVNMDVCVLNPFFYPYKGGTEKVILEVYTRLSKRHNITVITSAEKGRSKSIEEQFGIKVIRLKTKYIKIPNAPLPFLSFEKLNEEIKKVKADLYHINNRFQYFRSNINAIKSTGKLALTIHNSLPSNIDILTDSFGLFYDVFWGRAIMREADVITGVSKSAIDVTVPKNELSKAHLIYNGVDFKRFRKVGKKEKAVSALIKELGFEGPSIVCNGRLTLQKGQLYLMEATQRLFEHGINVNLLLLGKGPVERKLVNKAKALGIADRFAIRGGLGDDELRNHYAVGDIAVLPSLYEPASLAALESMACELPVIASNVGGLPEMVGKCGVLVEPRNVDEIEKSILKLLNNPQKVMRMAKCGRAHVIAHHDWGNIAKNYERLFLNTVNA